MEKVRNQCIMTNDEIIDRPVRDAVRTTDTIESDNSCLHEKSIENYNFTDKEARSAFPNVLSAASLKCSFGLSTNGKSEFQINALVLDDSCPRCSEPEDWNCMLQCGCAESKRNECLIGVRKKLGKADKTNVDQM